MRVDVSELKVFRKCKRQWAFSSRNKMHLRSTVTPKALTFGKVFHECLHSLYLNKPIELSKYESTLNEEDINILRNIINKYAQDVLPADLEKYEILEIELRFEYPIHGSIDMIVKHKVTGEIFGIEHKSGKSFRADIYNMLDEQPLVYFAAIKHKYGRCDGIFINEVKKLKTKLQQKRSKCKYTDKEIQYFLDGVNKDVNKMQTHKDQNIFHAYPDFMKCQICEFVPLCLELKVTGNLDIVTPELLNTYGFEVRQVDHLDEDKEGGESNAN